ncbi:DUF4283 domain protein, partial [Trifolium medium]|nr:DUF4283 domain protein [Trifolium medium]
MEELSLNDEDDDIELVIDVDESQPGKGMDIEEAYPVLNTLMDDEHPREVLLVNVPFWIQVHDLPAGFMSQKTGKNIGDYIGGEFLEYDEKNDSLSWRKYIRIRVLVDVRKPLKKYKKIKKQGGHSDSKCPKLFDMAENEIKKDWSPELRADMGRKQGGESKWLRQRGDPDWIVPNPVLMNNQCGSSKTGANSTCSNDGTNAPHDERKKGVKLAEIFREPALLFPTVTGKIKSTTVNVEETMEEDGMEELIVEGDRKRSRSVPLKKQEQSNRHVHEGNNNKGDVTTTG